MPKKGAHGSRDWRLARLTHMEEYMHQFIRQLDRPSMRFPKMIEAMEEVSQYRELLSLELSGDVPRIRRGKMGV